MRIREGRDVSLNCYFSAEVRALSDVWGQSAAGCHVLLRDQAPCIRTFDVQSTRSRRYSGVTLGSLLLALENGSRDASMVLEKTHVLIIHPDLSSKLESTLMLARF